MAFALVGSAGTAVQTTSGAALTTATFGTGETRTAGNLLLFFVTVTGSATLPGTPSGGWAIGAQLAGTSCSATVYYKVAAGSDTAPTISAITSGLIAGHLEEWSGNASANPVDETGTNAGTTSPRTATLSAANEATSNLVAMAGADRRSVARASNDTWTSNHGTPTLRASNNGTSSTDHYSHATLISNSIAAADTAIMTLSITTSITGLAVAAVSFRQSGTLTYTPAIITNTASASAPTITTLSAISVGLITQTATIAAPTISQSAAAQNLTLGLIDQTATISAPSLSVGYEATVRTDSPFAYYRMGESSGSVLDSIGSNHGTTSGTLTRDVSGVIGSTAGDDGAISFNGGHWTATVPLLGQVFSIEVWVEMGATWAGTTVINGNPLNFYIFVSPTGRVTCNTGGSAVQSAEGALTPGRHHIVWSRAGTSAGQQKLYIDGVDSSVTTAGTTNPNTATAFRFANYIFDGEPLIGKGDELALYSTALSGARVLAHFTAGQSQTVNAGFIAQTATISAPTITKLSTIAAGFINQTATISAPTVYKNYGSAVLADAPVAWYRLGEPSGAVLDEIPGGTSGTIDAAHTRDATGALLISQDDGAINFTGSATGIDIPHQSKLNLGDGPFTLEAWIRPNAYAGSWISKETGAYQLTTIGDGRMVLIKAGVELVKWSDTTITLGAWTHVVATVNGATRLLYINGVEHTDPYVVASTFVDTAQPLHIGYEGPLGELFDGEIDEVAIYNTVLSGARVLAHYNAAGYQNAFPALINQTATIAAPTVSVGYEATVRSDSPIAYYRLGEASGDAIDSIAAANAGPIGTITRDVTGLITASQDDGAISLAAAGYFNIPGAVSPWSGDFSIEAWAKPASASIYAAVYSNESYGVNGFRLGQQGSQWAFWTSESGGSVNITAAVGTVVVGQATHLVVTRSGSTFRLYVNGVDVGNSTGAYVAPPGGGDLGAVGGGEFSGVIDEVSIYGTALSGARALAHFNAGGGTQSVTLGLINQTATISAPKVYLGYSATVMADAPSGYWRLGEPSGTTATDERLPGFNDGTYVNTPTLGVTGALVGDANTGVTFNGTDERLTLPSGFEMGTAGSWEFWIKRSATQSATQYLMDKGPHQPNASFNSSNILAVTDDVAVVMVASSVAITDQTWHHVVFTHAGNGSSDNKLYIDGSDVSTNQNAKTLATTGFSIIVGASYVPSAFFPGSFDEVAIYGTALSAARVLAHYTAGTGGAVTQTYTPALINQTATISAPTITTANAYTPALINQTAVSSAPTVTTTNAISVGIITQTASASSPTITTGAVAASVGIINQAAAAFAPTITTGVVSVAPGLINQTATISAPSLSLTVFPNLITQTAVISTATITKLNTIAVGLINQAATASSPTITTGVVNVDLGRVNQTATASAPTITTGAVSVTPNLITQTAVISAATVTTANSVALGLINQTATASAPTVTAGAAAVSIGLINQTAQASAPTITTGAVSVTLPQITQTATTFSPSVSLNVALGLITQTATISAASVARHVHPNFINQAAVANTPNLTATASVSVAQITQTAATSSPTITTANAISLGLITQAATSFAPTVQQQQFVSAGFINQTATASAPAITTISPAAVGFINQTAAGLSPVISTTYAVSLGLIDRTAQIYEPVVDAGQTFVFVPRIEATATTQAPTISVGAAPLTIGLINQTAQISAPAVSTLSAVSVGLISQPAAPFSPSITTANTISVSLINQTATASVPTVSTGVTTVELGLIGQLAATFAPSLTASSNVSLDLIDQTAIALELAVAIIGDQNLDLGLIDQSAVAYGLTITGGVQEGPSRGPGRWYGWGSTPQWVPPPADQRLTLATIRAGTRTFTPSVNVSDDEVLLGLSEEDLLVLA